MLHARNDYNRIQDPSLKIGKDEPVFLARCKDKHFIGVLEDYLARVTAEKGYDVAIEIAIVAHIERAKRWQQGHPVHLPDMELSDVVQRDIL